MAHSEGRNGSRGIFHGSSQEGALWLTVRVVMAAEGYSMEFRGVSVLCLYRNVSLVVPSNPLHKESTSMGPGFQKM